MRLLSITPAAKQEHHWMVMSLVYAFAISILLCSVHCVVPAQVSPVSGHHHHHDSGVDQDHKLCGICTGAIPSPLASGPYIEVLLPALAFLPHLAVRGRAKWLFWAEPRAPPVQLMN